VIFSLWRGRSATEENTIDFAVLDKEKEGIFSTECGCFGDECRAKQNRDKCCCFCTFLSHLRREWCMTFERYSPF
jgi:hypothetical protein